MSEKYVCIRFYPNFSAKFTIRDKEGMESWLEYNEKMRPGNSLFINGQHIAGTGYMANRPDEIAIAQKFCQDNQAKYEAMDIFTIGDQIEFLGGKSVQRRGYPDDRDIYFTVNGRTQSTLR